MRHYEDEGLIVPGRCGNGFRDYCRSTIERVLVIRSLLESGLPVRLIRELLPDAAEGSDVGTGAVGAEFLREVEGYRDRLAARIAVLREQQAALDAYLRQARRAETVRRGLPAGPDHARVAGGSATIDHDGTVARRRDRDPDGA